MDIRTVFFVAATAISLALVGRDIALEPEDRRPARAEQPPAPPAAPQQTAGATSFSKAPDGHFWAEASVNGARVRFLVDTGASIVALTPSDAQRVGLNPRALAFDATIRTAGGPVPAARIALERISVGGLEERDIDAVVLTSGLDHSLLGMSFLERFSRVEATRDTLILRR